jgi:hypothetical protein
VRSHAFFDSGLTGKTDMNLNAMAQHESVARIEALNLNRWPETAGSGHGADSLLADAHSPAGA